MYHISTNDFGEITKMSPKLYAQEDIAIKRICVAPSIEDCLSSSEWFDFWDDEPRDIYVYYSKSKQSAVPCSEEIKDRHITNEHWYLEPAYFQKKLTIESGSVLHKKLVDAILSCWGDLYDRAICSNLEIQQKERDLFSLILEKTDWTKDLVKTKENQNDLSLVFFDKEDELSISM